MELNEDMLPGFRALPVIGVSILTGMGAALAAFVLVVAGSPLLSFSAYEDLELFHAVATIVALGAAVERSSSLRFVWCWQHGAPG